MRDRAERWRSPARGDSILTSTLQLLVTWALCAGMVAGWMMVSEVASFYTAGRFELDARVHLMEAVAPPLLDPGPLDAFLAPRILQRLGRLTILSIADPLRVMTGSYDVEERRLREFARALRAARRLPTDTARPDRALAALLGDSDRVRDLALRRVALQRDAMRRIQERSAAAVDADDIVRRAGGWLRRERRRLVWAGCKEVAAPTVRRVVASAAAPTTGLATWGMIVGAVLAVLVGFVRHQPAWGLVGSGMTVGGMLGLGVVIARALKTVAIADMANETRWRRMSLNVMGGAFLMGASLTFAMVICQPLRPWLLAPFAAAMLAGVAGAAIDDLRRPLRGGH
jgi:hypothetical protein